MLHLNSYQSDTAQLEQPSLDWANKFYFNSSRQQVQADTWVKLLELPSSFSYDEALLLCQLSSDEWLAWIPDHGEAVLHARQFCPVTSR